MGKENKQTIEKTITEIDLHLALLDQDVSQLLEPQKRGEVLREYYRLSSYGYLFQSFASSAMDLPI